MANIINLTHAHAAELITSCLIAQGLDEDSATLAANTAIKVQIAAGMISPLSLAVWEREATIYKLRGQRITVCALAERYGVSLQTIFTAIRRAKERRKAAFLAVS